MVLKVPFDTITQTCMAFPEDHDMEELDCHTEKRQETVHNHDNADQDRVHNTNKELEPSGRLLKEKDLPGPG